ncbi:hypothetical protein K523DRAFT_141570 [Schizophyllum commune Tattone D]|nr:hypothetical protein K523DRAFT_141570 [Schizophyllum commune Tattone D]
MEYTRHHSLIPAQPSRSLPQPSSLLSHPSSSIHQPLSKRPASAAIIYLPIMRRCTQSSRRTRSVEMTTAFPAKVRSGDRCDGLLAHCSVQARGRSQRRARRECSEKKSSVYERRSGDIPKSG